MKLNKIVYKILPVITQTEEMGVKHRIFMINFKLNNLSPILKKNLI